MNVEAASCPSQTLLAEFGLGKLDATISSTVLQHIETCHDCRRFVASVSGDDFFDRLKDAKRAGALGRSAGAAEAESVSVSRQVPETVAGRNRASRSVAPGGLSAAEGLSIPPELAGHPDYELLKVLGQGGMGVVYLARNRIMDRLEVLKVMSRALVDRPGALERFQQEIRSAARLQHPNIVSAYSVLQPGNLLVFAMEFVAGEDLSQVVRRVGPLPVIHAAYYAQQVAVGLQHAHEKGMVHRDIKPNNLILTREGKRRLVKILDFGLAKITSDKQAEAGLTHTGQILGTPDYLAPEQILDAQRADIRSDIYSLGCTLYYLLAGRAPFDNHSLYATLRAHQTLEAKPLNLLRPDVPSELSGIVGRMMAKNPGLRFQTPADVAQSLSRLLKKGAQDGGSVAAEVSQPSPARSADSAACTPPPLPAGSSIPSPVIRAIPVVPPPQSNQVYSVAPTFDPALRHPGLARRRDRRRRATVAIGSALALVGILAIWAGARSTDGVLVLNVNEPNPDLRVDGVLTPVHWDAEGKRAEIAMRAGVRKVELRKTEFNDLVEQLVVEPRGQTTLVAKLERFESPQLPREPKPLHEPQPLREAQPPTSEPQPGKSPPALPSPAAPVELAASGATTSPAPIPAAANNGNDHARELAASAALPGPSSLEPMANAEQPAAASTTASGATSSSTVAPLEASQAKKLQASWAKRLRIPIESKNSVQLPMMLIPPGEFLMGSAQPEINASRSQAAAANFKPDAWQFERLKEEVPQHRVVLTKPFLLSATEVTVDQFRKFVDDAKYVTEAERFGFGDAGSSEPNAKTGSAHANWKSPGYLITEDSPVTQVTWNDAVQFCNWLSKREKLSPAYREEKSVGWARNIAADGYRLPTEAEWEYACRAGVTAQFSWGDDPAALDAYCWHSGNSGGIAHAVGVKLPNPFGLFDIHGNVCEWCSDFYAPEYYRKSPTEDPQGPEFGTAHAVRGDITETFCRAAFRFFHHPTCRHRFVGIRLARSLPADSPASNSRVP